MAGFVGYETYDATGLAALIAGGQVSAAEVLGAAIERAERWQPSINAITIPLYEHARAAAHTGLPAGPLSGVPFLLKDLGAQLTGTRTSGSGKLWGDFVVDHDSTLVARYHAAGLNIFGKSASPEMGLAPSTEPAMYGPCRNPWNLAYSAGDLPAGRQRRWRRASCRLRTRPTAADRSVSQPRPAACSASRRPVPAIPPGPMWARDGAARRSHIAAASACATVRLCWT